MSSATTPAAASGSSGSSTDLWSDILRSADRSTGGRETYNRKNIIVLSEKRHGRRYLIDQLVASSASSSSSASASASKRRKLKNHGPRLHLAMGYDVLEVKDEAGEEDVAPPVSIFYPPSSHSSMLKLVPKSLPPNPLSDTAVVIVLDWTRPSSMVREIVQWLDWVERWAKDTAERGQGEELRDRLQSHIQHYTEPQPSSGSGGSASTPSLPSLPSTYGSGPLLPLGQGTLTLNSHGIPIVVVCTKADLMDNVGDEMGMKGGGWEERTDWVQQVLRTICLAYGAALFYTAPTQPHTYTLLRTYLLHRLYTIPPPLNPPSDAPPPPSVSSSSSRFPFPHRANVLDGDAVMVPTGWDSWGKINVLREGFDPARVGRVWQVSLDRMQEGEDEGDDGEEGLEDLWVAMIPDTEREPRPTDQYSISTTTEPEQTFLARQLDILQKDPNRDPRASFRQAAAAVSASASASASTSASGAAGATSGMGTGEVGGVVGPMGTGGLNLPGVEKAMAEMEGGTAEDLKERFAKLGRRESTRSGGPLSPTGGSAGSTPGAGTGSGTVPNEALHNFFQGLLATKGKSSIPSGKMAPPPVPSGGKTSPKPE